MFSLRQQIEQCVTSACSVSVEHEVNILKAEFHTRFRGRRRQWGWLHKVRKDENPFKIGLESEL